MQPCLILQRLGVSPEARLLLLLLGFQPKAPRQVFALLKILCSQRPRELFEGFVHASQFIGYQPGGQIWARLQRMCESHLQMVNLCWALLGNNLPQLSIMGQNPALPVNIPIPTKID